MVDSKELGEQISAENIVSYGEGFFGLTADYEKFKSVIRRGIVPERWIKSSGFSNTSYDSVCMTVIPQSNTAESRYKAMSAQGGNMNHFVDMQLSQQRPHYLPDDSVVLGIVIDLSEATKLGAIDKTKTNGKFDPLLYPTTHIDGIDDHQLVKGKRGSGGGFSGEVRLNFNEEKDSRGIDQDLWKGMIVKVEDYPKIQNWADTAKQEGINIKSLPVFSTDMALLGTLV